MRGTECRPPGNEWGGSGGQVKRVWADVVDVEAEQLPSEEQLVSFSDKKVSKDQVTQFCMSFDLIKVLRSNVVDILLEGAEKGAPRSES